MAGTPRLSLPFIAVGQAQKEFTHNESLQILDMLVAGAVEEPPRATAPATPDLGACYIVGNDATGDWEGRSSCLAAWTSGGWRFVSPTEGMCLYERTTGTPAVFRGGSWQIGILHGSSLRIAEKQVVGERAAAIESAAGGAVVDLEVRSTVDAILNALRQHGLIES